MEDDTIKLLKECNAGVKMGISSIEDVIDEVTDEKLRKLLKDSKDAHCRLGDETHRLLSRYHDDGKEPALMAQVMSKVKTNIKLMSENVNEKAADLITDGCGMGIKALYKYLNQYKDASDDAKKLAGEIVTEEEKLEHELRAYL